MQTKWIWISGIPAENLYAIARTEFVYSGETAPELRVSADSNFAAFLNGCFIGCGQFSDFPDRKTYSAIPLAPKPGSNLLEIRVYFCGGNFLTHIKGTPRLWAEVRCGEKYLTQSSSAWLMAEAPAFRSGPIAKVNPMLGYTWEYDARSAEPEFRNAVELPMDNQPQPRPVPMLFPQKPLPAQTVYHGVFERVKPGTSPATAMATDRIAPAYTSFNGLFDELPPDADGRMLLVDLQKECAGLLYFEVTAPAGTILDIAHGEHIEQGRVLCGSPSGDRNYADRYICREGKNEFTSYFRRYGARYLELHVSGTRGPVTVHQLTLLPTELPLAFRAAFHAPDRLLEATHKIGMRTLELCMHEHYEDCPWREQSLYGYDSRNQMLFGYYAFGNRDFAAASLDLLGYSMLEHGFLNLTAPGDLGLCIPVFTFAWLAALYEHELYTGSREPYQKHREKILAAIPKFLARPTPEGLYLPPVDLQGTKTWNFCEWIPGLDGSGPGGAESDRDAEIPTAFYNLYLVEALRAVAALEQDDALRSRADQLGKRVEGFFWNEEAGCYATRPGDSRLHSHIQYLMLTLDLVPAERCSLVADAASSPRLAASGFSAYIYLIRALMKMGRGAEAEARMRRDFDRMTLAGATSFWEVPEGGRAFGGAGSLCHGWSCAGIYFDGACRLGVIPLEPGFRTFALEIVPGGLASLSGEVPTPYGPIAVAWEKEGEFLNVRLHCPPGTRLARKAADIRLI